MKLGALACRLLRRHRLVTVIDDVEPRATDPWTGAMEYRIRAFHKQCTRCPTVIR